MNKNNLLPHPYIRLLFLLLSIGGTFIAVQISQVVIYYLLVLLPLTALSKQIKAHFRFILIGILPIFLSLILINILILDGKSGSWFFILLKISKLTVYASIFQFVFFIPTIDLLNTLKKWNLKGEALITIISSFTVWNEIINNANKIVTARLARGYIGKRNIINMAKQLPYVLNPLVIGVMRTSIERAETWDKKQIISLVQNIENDKTSYSFTYNLLMMVFAAIYFLFGIYSKFYWL